MSKAIKNPGLPFQLEDGTIDAGLIVLQTVTPPGATWTQQEIADVCGCSKGYIWWLEKTAKKKIRRAFSRLRAEGEL